MTDVPDTTRIIYHYCGANGFYGILRSKALWLSDAYFMNDYMEHRLVLDKAVEYLEALGKEPVNRRFCERVRESLRTVPIHPYVCCFSSKRDMLSQWRAYSDDGAGFAIGFSRDGIEDRCALSMNLNKGVTFRQVEYEPSDQEKQLREAIANRLALYLKRFPEQQTAGSNEGLEIATAHALVWDLATVCKNHGFREEGEYRIVRMPQARRFSAPNSPVPIDTFEMLSRVSDGGIVTYFEFGFSTEDVAEIWLGPKNHGRESKYSVDVFLQTNGYDVDRIRIFEAEASYGRR
jgi:hypothetical protein